MEPNEQLCSWCEDALTNVVRILMRKHWCAFLENEEPDPCSCTGRHYR